MLSELTCSTRGLCALLGLPLWGGSVVLILAVSLLSPCTPALALLVSVGCAGGGPIPSAQCLQMMAAFWLAAGTVFALFVPHWQCTNWSHCGTGVAPNAISIFLLAEVLFCFIATMYWTDDSAARSLSRNSMAALVFVVAALSKALIAQDHAIAGLSEMCNDDTLSRLEVAAARPPQRTCLHGMRLLVVIASWGTENDAHLSHALASLAQLRGRHVNATVRIDRTIPMAESRSLRLPAGLIVQEVLWNSSVGWGLTGRHRRHFTEGLQQGAFDYYLYMEDDLRIRPVSLEALCAANAHLKSELEAVPVLLRYETKSENRTSSKFLPDMGICCPPQIHHVWTHRGRRYTELRKPYSAMYFLPAARLARFIARYEQAQGKRWVDAGQTRVKYPQYDTIRILNAGLWLFWQAGARGVVPADDGELRSHLLRHLSNKYLSGVRPGAQQTGESPFEPSVQLWNAAVRCYRGQPLALLKSNSQTAADLLNCSRIVVVPPPSPPSPSRWWPPWPRWFRG